ncbi:MAG: TOBE domain-containing protein [Clostridiales bacterium]|nr:TOBE domain-containing protein [Clostridiales bacterium]
MNFIPCAAAKGGVILKGSDGVLKLPARFAGALAKREGGEITLGFRPEAARFGGGQKAGGGVAFEARAQVLELFGDSVSIFAEIGGHSVILKTDPDHMPEENETVKFTVPADGIYLFESGQNEASIEA